MPKINSFANLKNNSAGFTLIELLVVISIIGLLASVVLVALNGARAKARDAKRVSDIRSIATAMELFMNDTYSYPTTPSSVVLNSWGVLQTTYPIICPNAVPGCINYLIPGYVSKIPTAPTPADSAICRSNYGGDIANSYQFASTGGSSVTSTYAITFCLGAATGGYSAGIHTLTPSGVQ